MKIVVTGALGHIGSRLIRELPAAFPGAEIFMIDNMLTQRYPSLFNLPEGVTYRFLEGDVLKLDMEKILTGAQAVVHLAAITDAASSFEKRELVETVNYNATLKVAEACVKTGCAMFHISSTSVYGTQDEVVDEDCPESDLQPQSPYAETKLKEERLLQELGAQGLRFMIARFGTISGVSPGIRFHTAVNKFCWQAVLGQPLTVWRTAMHQKRPYLELGDAVAAVGFAIRNDLFDRRVYNVVTNNHTVDQIVNMIRRHVPTLKIEYVDTRIMNQLSYDVSFKRFAAAGFSPAGSLESSISQTIALLSGIKTGLDA